MIWEGIVVGLIVLVAAGYAAFALLPVALRQPLAARFVARARRAGQPAWLSRFADRIEQGVRRQPGACGDCSAAQPVPARDADKRPDKA